MIHRLIFEGEVLEIDNHKILKNKKLFFKLRKIFKILITKIIRNIYRYFQRKIIRPTVRERLKYFESFLKRKNKIKHSEVASELRETSFVYIENLLKDDEIKNLKYKTISNNNLNEIYLSVKNFNYNKPPLNAKMGYVESYDLFNFNEVFKAASNPNLLAILDSYFKCEYFFDWAWAWWSFSSNENNYGPQNFHRDYENLNFIKVFIYLTDVENETDGAHEIIKGSHKINKLYTIRRYSDEEVSDSFSKNKQVKIFGKKGTSFIANTFAIHKGNLPTSKDRLVLSLLYSVIPSRRSPKIPFLKIETFSKEVQKNITNNKKKFSLFFE